MSGAGLRDFARLVLRHGLGNRLDMLPRRAAAAADDVDEAFAREAFDLLGHEFRAFVILTEGVGQAGIGIGADERIGGFGELRQMRAHGGRAERAVQPDGEGFGVAHGVPEGGRRLAGQRPAGQVGDRAGNHDGRSTPFSSKTSKQAKIAALAFSVSKMVSMRMISAPPSIRPRSCSA